MIYRQHAHRWFIALAVLVFFAQDARGGGPYEGDRYLPQRRFHGYYPTIWRPWASGWQAPIHKDNLPQQRPQTPTVAPEPLPPSEDAPPAPPSDESLPLEPLRPSTPAPDSDEAPALPTPPGLESTLPEPATPGTPTPPGLEEMMPAPTTPGSAPGASPPALPDSPLETPPDSPLQPPAGLEEPGLTSPNLDEKPNPSMPPGFEMPNLDDEAFPNTPPTEESQEEPETSERSGRLPQSRWRGASNVNSPDGRPLHNRLRGSTSPMATPNENREFGEPRRLSMTTPEARPLPQRLPAPNDRIEGDAVQVRFNTPTTTSARVETSSDRWSDATENSSSQRHNPLRTQQEPARKVVRLNNPLR